MLMFIHDHTSISARHRAGEPAHPSERPADDSLPDAPDDHLGAAEAEYSGPAEEEQRLAAATFLGSFVMRGYLKRLNGHGVKVLRGSHQTGTEPVLDPLTGEQTGERPVHRQPPIPIGKTHHYILHDGKNANGEHRAFRSIADHIASGHFQKAVSGYTQLLRTANRAAEEDHPGKLRSLASKSHPGGPSYEAGIIAIANDLRHTAYDAVMEVPNELPESDEDGEEAHKWDAVLELHNIQALRTHVTERWLARAQAPGFT